MIAQYRGTRGNAYLHLSIHHYTFPHKHAGTTLKTSFPDNGRKTCQRAAVCQTETTLIDKQNSSYSRFSGRCFPPPSFEERERVRSTPGLSSVFVNSGSRERNGLRLPPSLPSLLPHKYKSEPLNFFFSAS
ncbi:hypothetical protein TNCV_4355631 [Trichonephila clavipes]|nr:hypothetical protein TNCV_4355631 [Trichonephila clavipes]